MRGFKSPLSSSRRENSKFETWKPASIAFGSINTASCSFLFSKRPCTADTVEITQIDEIDIHAVVRDVDCYDNNTGRISVNPNLGGGISGGTPNYNLQWNPSGTGSGQTVNGLSAGTYSLSVTDVNGCIKVDTFEVNEPSILVSNVSQNGSILNATASGGTPSYTYRWKEFSSPSTTLQIGNSYMVLSPGILKNFSSSELIS